MREKIVKAGLVYDLIAAEFKDLNIYKEALVFFLNDQHFIELKETLEYGDYEMAEDITKGLFTMAEQLKLFNLSENLIDIYEALLYEDYKEIMELYSVMILQHKKLYEVFNG